MQADSATDSGNCHLSQLLQQQAYTSSLLLCSSALLDCLAYSKHVAARITGLNTQSKLSAGHSQIRGFLAT
jgi:hypothetical protein